MSLGCHPPFPPVDKEDLAVSLSLATRTLPTIPCLLCWSWHQVVLVMFSAMSVNTTPGACGKTMTTVPSCTTFCLPWSQSLPFPSFASSPTPLLLTEPQTPHQLSPPKVCRYQALLTLCFLPRLPDVFRAAELWLPRQCTACCSPCTVISALLAWCCLVLFSLLLHFGEASSSSFLRNGEYKLNF